MVCAHLKLGLDVLLGFRGQFNFHNALMLSQTERQVNQDKPPTAGFFTQSVPSESLLAECRAFILIPWEPCNRHLGLTTHCAAANNLGES